MFKACIKSQMKILKKQKANLYQFMKNYYFKRVFPRAWSTVTIKPHLQKLKVDILTLKSNTKVP